MKRKPIRKLSLEKIEGRYLLAAAGGEVPSENLEARVPETHTATVAPQRFETPNSQLSEDQVKASLPNNARQRAIQAVLSDRTIHELFLFKQIIVDPNIGSSEFGPTQIETQVDPSQDLAWPKPNPIMPTTKTDAFFLELFRDSDPIGPTGVQHNVSTVPIRSMDESLRATEASDGDRVFSVNPNDESGIATWPHASDSPGISLQPIENQPVRLLSAGVTTEELTSVPSLAAQSMGGPAGTGRGSDLDRSEIRSEYIKPRHPNENVEPTESKLRSNSRNRSLEVPPIWATSFVSLSRPEVSQFLDIGATKGSESSSDMGSRNRQMQPSKELSNPVGESVGIAKERDRRETSVILFSDQLVIVCTLFATLAAAAGIIWSKLDSRRVELLMSRDRLNESRKHWT